MKKWAELREKVPDPSEFALSGVTRWKWDSRIAFEFSCVPHLLLNTCYDSDARPQMSGIRLDDGVSVMENPQLSDRISIDVLGYNEEDSQNIRCFIQSAVSYVIEVIALTCLKKIIVSQCYKNGIIAANARYQNCPTEFVPTSNDLAEGVAATIPYNCEGNLITVIVFGPYFVDCMFADGTVTATGRTAQLLHHELAHSFDYEIRFRRFGTDFFAIELPPEQAFLRKLCNRLWSEYFASRWGALLSEGNSSGDDLLENAHFDFNLSLTKAIKEYKLGRLTAEEFNSLLVAKTQFLLDVLARVLGHFDAYPYDDNPNARSFRFVQSSCAVDLLPFHQVLKELWDACAKWKSVDDFLALNLPTRSLLRHHGISVKTNPSCGYYLELVN